LYLKGSEETSSSLILRGIFIKIEKYGYRKNKGPLEILQNFQVGKEIIFTILRGGEKRKVKVILSERK